VRCTWPTRESRPTSKPLVPKLIHRRPDLVVGAAMDGQWKASAVSAAPSVGVEPVAHRSIASFVSAVADGAELVAISGIGQLNTLHAGHRTFPLVGASPSPGSPFDRRPSLPGGCGRKVPLSTHPGMVAITLLFRPAALREVTAAGVTSSSKRSAGACIHFRSTALHRPGLSHVSDVLMGGRPLRAVLSPAGHDCPMNRST
jgi:hypothetical protein